MAQPAISWTGAAVVNGLMAVVLMVWLADVSIPSPIPEQSATAPAPDRATERPSDRPIKLPSSIDLPPPPTAADLRHDSGPTGVTHLASPMRPSPHRGSERPIEFVPLRAAETRPRPAKAPMRPSVHRASERPIEFVPLRAAETRTHPAKAPIPLGPVAERVQLSNPDIAGTPDREGSGSTKPNVRSTQAEVVVDAEAMRTGRALLRIFEHGEGPQIEIAWPGSTAQRERLHDVLRRCFGMRLALIDRAGGLYLDDGPMGRTWPIDLDRFSGFVRRPNGQITSAERRVAGRVARYHRRLPATDPIRLFPRATDAALLGGLAHLLGEDYRSSKAITASYRLRGGRVTIDQIRVDGRSVAGEIDLTRGASAACRRTGRT